jgi:hypothetical protein
MAKSRRKARSSAENAGADAGNPCVPLSRLIAASKHTAALHLVLAGAAATNQNAASSATSIYVQNYDHQLGATAVASSSKSLPSRKCCA